MRQTVAQQRIVVLGATGATGRLVVSTAVGRGHHVTALVRRSGSLAPAAGLQEVEWPDVHDAATLSAALDGADAVVSALGGAAKAPTSVCTDAMAATVPATGRYRVSDHLPVRLWTSVGRADLADFLVDEVEDPRHVRAYPRIAA
ncbi:NAD(P)-dependent oxidoreductase [Cellulomonas phragmiteti]|uniref:NAD(P)-binding domain-containing protein n=1 Tax=Cellulomonas phragmiteti TaxID=478780 RepID=A0ABQ4DMH7_9CELL|nr:NAD(P)H-binding protein [Cellulomonas phragmiteti]GIG40560.1 hypothetical protein Cph01nite_23220 [Cellulomonas phragmiteti]